MARNGAHRAPSWWAAGGLAATLPLAWRRSRPGLVWLMATTVKTHVAHLLAKPGLRGRVHAVIFAYESGLAHPGNGLV